MLEQLLHARRLLAVAVVSTVLVGACSAGAIPSPKPATQPPVASPVPASPSVPGIESPSAAASPPASGSASVYDVKVVATGAKAPYLTGEDGKTLYVYAKDTANTSTCTGGCAGAWPPFTLDTGETTKAGAGVNGTLATTTRADGKMQVTYNGKPLYYFGATVAGDTSGDGVGGAWSVAKP